MPKLSPTPFASFAYKYRINGSQDCQDRSRSSCSLPWELFCTYRYRKVNQEETLNCFKENLNRSADSCSPHMFCHSSVCGGTLSILVKATSADQVKDGRNLEVCTGEEQPAGMHFFWGSEVEKFTYIHRKMNRQYRDMCMYRFSSI